MTAHRAPLTRRSFLSFAGVGAVGMTLPTSATAVDADRVTLRNTGVRVEWAQGPGGWRVDSLHVRTPRGWQRVFAPAGTYGVVSYLESEAPDREAVRRAQVGRYHRLRADEVTSGRPGGELRFVAEHPTGMLTATWQADPAFGYDLLVTLTWTPSQAGWYSLASPTIATVPEGDLGWSIVPGYWTSSTSATDTELSRRYGIGVPTVPFLSEERSTPSLVAAIESASREVTLAASPVPSLARDPWPSDHSEQSEWQVALSPRELDGMLAPTVFAPVLGQRGSRLEAGQSTTVTFRISTMPGPWREVTDHITHDVFDLGSYLALARNLDSLTHRVNRMHDFLVTPASQWHTWTFKGLELGAESDKLSDVGAMWMMARLTDDPIFVHDRLPYARNFKLAQQETEPGPFHGAALGEYYSAKDGRWVSENYRANTAPFNQDYVSPMFTTFYTLADVGNILLFEPDDAELRERLRLGAERLLEWQHDDGSFDIGYLRTDPSELIYPELPDLRATWYGFIPAYRILGDKRYLDAARRGADWFVDNAVRTGNFIGVCDDVRLVPDFQIIFAAQALLEMHDLTGDPRYRKAAIDTATFYTLHIFDHPEASDEPKTFNGGPVEDWQLSQVGGVVEHAGYHGSANGNGPITLASHAGAFVRFYELTKRRIFLDLARAAARGRDEFVGERSGIPSYYWAAGNGGSTVFPWHGWWHLGWVHDYLLAEAHLRSKGKIAFPQGFCTAKVGSHRPTGFAPGRIYGQPAVLAMPRTLMTADQPDVDWLAARSTDGERLFVVALNESPDPVDATLRLNPRGVSIGQLATWKRTKTLAGTARPADDDQWSVHVDGNGITVFAIDLTLTPDPEGPELRDFTIDGTDMELHVSWSYWDTVTSWAQWRVRGQTDWTDTPRQEGYVLGTTIDIADVEAPATIEVRVATIQPNGVGHTEPLEWTIPQPVIVTNEGSPPTGDPDQPPYEEAGTWYGSSLPSYDGSSTRYSGEPGATATWRASLRGGTYQVAAWYPQHTNCSSEASYTVQHAGGSTDVRVDQCAGGDDWQDLGTFTFERGLASVVLTVVDGTTRADAIRFTPAE